MELLGFESLDVVFKDKLARKEKWSRSIAVGN
ncbi:MAG: hypothetical protein QG618_2279, partial [Thermodesulfobacteriota bacterium]|nr:hypothetical protein [Thermodesulfobacteriota bacterium]